MNGASPGPSPLLRAGALLTLAVLAVAQVQEPTAPAAPAAPPAGDSGQLSPEQLEQMLAPIALYPDDLLAQILMACTYPLEIVQADRWAKEHKTPTGDEAARLLEEQTWDPSVKSLVATPDVLAMLSDELDWTQQLGDAFLGQQEAVMEAIQSLRKKAQEAGHLPPSDELKVETSGDTFAIESSDPDVIDVPCYDTTIVYGPWLWPYYPPYPYHPPGYRHGVAVGIAIGFAWGYAWGHCDWHGGDVDIDIDRNVNRNKAIDRNKARMKAGNRGSKMTWKHDPAHRGNLPYRDDATAKRFGGVTDKQAVQARDAFRGKTEALGDRTGGVADRAGTSAGARDRVGESSRGSASTRDVRGTKSDAFDGSNRSRSQVQRDSARGRVSRGGGGRVGGRGGGRGR
ncbi:MAG TPA: DUF3300 domain-containing protein [Planctomycetota bacterium]|nr:DUF3300 domain-containing protein [Planctomycetota bacterium]